MSKATRLSRRSQAEQRNVEDYARQRLVALRAAGGDARVLSVALMTVGTYLAAGLEDAETVADDLEQCAKDIRARAAKEG